MDLAGIKLLWVERAAYPLQQRIMLGIGRIPNGSEEIFVAVSASAILRRASTSTVQATGVDDPLLDVINALKANLMKPRIPEIIFVDG